jgi:lysophospholipase L1-like esterase
MSEKRVLCYGDSNTWGYIPVEAKRYDWEKRWPGVLQELLGTGYRIIEEGLNGRTTVLDDPFQAGRNGHGYLLPCLESHKPLDLVVIMLGTNDMKHRYGLSPAEITRGMKVLVDSVQRSEAGRGATAPQLLILSPPGVGKFTDFTDMFAGAEEKSGKLGALYRELAAESGCAFINIGAEVKAGDRDGIHLEAEQHKNIAKMVARWIGEAL